MLMTEPTRLWGTVNLIPDQGLRLADTKHDGTIRTFIRGVRGLGRHLHARYRVPDHEAFLEHGTVLFCTKAMTTGTKVLTNRIVGSKESLSVTT